MRVNVSHVNVQGQSELFPKRPLTRLSCAFHSSIRTLKQDGGFMTNSKGAHLESNVSRFINATMNMKLKSVLRQDNMQLYLCNDSSHTCLINRFYTLSAYIYTLYFKLSGL